MDNTRGDDSAVDKRNGSNDIRDLNRHILPGDSLISAESIVRADRELFVAFGLTVGCIASMILYIIYSFHDPDKGARLSPVLFMPLIAAIIQLLQNRRLFRCPNCETLLDVSPKLPYLQSWQQQQQATIPKPRTVVEISVDK